jgi:protein involved in polysaccharide export with SLBB domain
MKLILLLTLCAPLGTTQGRAVFRPESADNLPARKIGPRELIGVQGAVRDPLTFQASGAVTLLEAITRAGGLTAAAGPEILVSKTQTGPDGQPTWLIERVSIQVLIDGTDAEANMVLSGGEEVRVPGASRVFVVGNVKRPGAFVVQDGAESSVLKVLSLAEGLVPNAGRQAYIFRREAVEGKNEIKIELSKIMDRKAADVTLLANDILYIPDSHTRRLGRTILEKLVLFGSTAGATVPMYGARLNPMADNGGRQRGPQPGRLSRYTASQVRSRIPRDPSLTLGARSGDREGVVCDTFVKLR